VMVSAAGCCVRVVCVGEVSSECMQGSCNTCCRLCTA
jgi:hypothetical protein